MRPSRPLYKRIGLLVVVLLVPFSLVYLFALGEPQRRQLHYFGIEKSLSVGNKDTVYKRISTSGLRLLDGSIIPDQNFKGKVLLVSTLYNTCPYRCPILLPQLKKFVFEEVLGNDHLDNVLFISLMEDNGHNISFEDMLAELDVDRSRWWFVKGEPDIFFDVALEDGRNPFQQDVGNSDFANRTYEELLLLIDWRGYIRGIYHGNKSPEFKRIKEDLWVLSKEWKDAKKDSQ